MFCKECGNEVKENAAVCLSCGCSTGNAQGSAEGKRTFCKECGKEANSNAVVCLGCGCTLGSGGTGTSTSGKNRTTAGLLAILFGVFFPIGVHKFYLGYTNEGIIYLVGTLVSWVLVFAVIGIFPLLGLSIISIIEGVIYLGKTDQDFEQQYVNARKGWF